MRPRPTALYLAFVSTASRECLKAKSRCPLTRKEAIMKENIDRSVWINYLNEFTRRNNSRPTRLEVFGENGAQEEERGLPFAGISLERGNGRPSIAMMF